MAIVKAKYFKESEFKACTPKCSMQDMSQQLLYMLDAAREIAGIPFVLNSAYRSKEWDKSKGRTGNSAHTRGLAVDIRCNSNANRFIILQALLQVGFTRIGVGKTYIHADIDKSLAQRVVWHYY